MNKELKQRVINFIGNLEVTNDHDDKEAGELYRLLTRPPGRQKGWRKKVLDNITET